MRLGLLMLLMANGTSGSARVLVVAVCVRPSIQSIVFVVTALFGYNSQST